MAQNAITQTISLVGGDEIKAQLSALGAAGEAAFKKLREAADVPGGGLAALGDATAALFGTFGKAKEALTPAAEAVASLHQNFGELGNTLGNIASTIFPSFRDAFGLGVAGLAAGMLKLTKGAAESVTEIKNMSTATGFSIPTLGALKDKFVEAGVATDKMLPALTHYADVLGKLREESIKLSGETADGIALLKGTGAAATAAGAGVSVLRGNIHDAALAVEGDTSVLRGGVKAVIDFHDAFKALGIDKQKFSQDAAGQEALLVAFSKALNGLSNETLKTSLGVQQFGREWKNVAAAWVEVGKGLEEVKAKRTAAGLDPTAEDIKRVSDYNHAYADLATVLERVKEKAGIAIMPAITEEMPKAAKAVEDMIATGEALIRMLDALQGAISRFPVKLDISIDTAKIKQAFSDLTGTIEAFIKSVGSAGAAIGNALGAGAWTVFTNAASTALSTVSGWVDTLRNKIGDLLSSLGSAAQGAVGGGSTSGTTVTIPQVPDFSSSFAGGGRVFGPGTGTSDSILARVSKGEYVVNSRATGQFLPLLNALNAWPHALSSLGQSMSGFSIGGLVGNMMDHFAPMPRFATGGLVSATAGAGRPRAAVHLHIGGSEFALETDQHTADRIERISRNEQMLSAGKRPSWFR